MNSFSASALFFISGFCGLLYQVVWIRMAFGSFGVIMPVLSVVVSVFMGGLGLGSWIGGRWANRFRTAKSAFAAYGVTELVIAQSAWAVPMLFHAGARLLLNQGDSDSANYLFRSAWIISAALFLWCFSMGLTYPFFIAALNHIKSRSSHQFSLLYLANTLGATCGAFMSAFVLIECIGLQGTLWFAGLLNALIACICLVYSRRLGTAKTETPVSSTSGTARKGEPFAILFTTAAVALGFEVIWTRDFTPVLGTTVFAFAAIVAIYLLATGAGSYWYRSHRRRSRSIHIGSLLGMTTLGALLPVAMNQPVLGMGGTVALISIVPFCAALGYLTPMLIDQNAADEPARVGQFYAVNIAGSVIGPLLASYVLLPTLGARGSILLLCAPLIGLFLRSARQLPAKQLWSGFAFAGVLVAVSALGSSYEEQCLHPGKNDRIARDYAGTVLCCGEGWERNLLVNGVGMSRLTFVTKEMAHLPLASLSHKPESALLICFGMGTTYRSLLSWGIQTTAVELIPTVPQVFDFFFDDADQVRRNPAGRITIDDGRRFLKRTQATYDVITLDPPPPVEASGSSLLYTTEFYALAKAHLKPGGILQQWWPEGEERILQAAARSIRTSFPYVRVFKGRGQHGFHFLASETPIRVPAKTEFIKRLPVQAAKDIRDWSPENRLDLGVQAMLSRELSIELFLPPDRPALITDDRPYNEYFFLRRLWDRLQGRFVLAR